MKHTQRLKLPLLFGAGLLAALVTLRFWQKVTAPGLSVPALQGLGLELAVQLLAIGVIGEYIGKVYLEVKARPRYLIAQWLNGESQDQAEEEEKETKEVQKV